MKIAVRDHQGKGRAFGGALVAAGHDLVATDPDILLIDHDGPQFYRSLIGSFPEAKVVVYPHGAMAYLGWDGAWQRHERTLGQLVMGPGQAEVMRLFYDRPVVPVGWPWGNMAPFRKVSDPKTVLFAPIHPLTNGFAYRPAALENGRVFTELLNLPVRLIVRTLGKPEASGLWAKEGVTYIMGAPDVSRALTEEADVVVAYDTFAYASIAAGRPTVVFGQDLVPWDGYSDGEIRLAKHEDEYHETIRFPIDAGPELGWALQVACVRNEVVEDWKRRMLGDPMTPAGLDTAIKDLVQ